MSGADIGTSGGSMPTRLVCPGTGLPSITTLPQPAIERRWSRATKEGARQTKAPLWPVGRVVHGPAKPVNKLSGDPNGDGGDPYTGYDRFTRVIRAHWHKPGLTPVSLVDVQWGYNRASLKIWRKDVLAPGGSEQDQYFQYDNRYQVTQRQRGVLDGSHTGIVGTPAQQETFGYDPAGNWTGYEQSNVGTLDIDQTRAHNASNQITSIDSVGTGVSYDNNGNMLEVPTGDQALDGPPRKLIWDAWNRLRKVYDDEDNLISEYHYDGQTRRVTSTVDGVGRHYYYDDQWRSLEERLDSSVNAERHHIWQPGNRWELILRDRSTMNNGTFDERLYSLKDELDPVALSDANGDVVERFAYSAFGKAAIFDDVYAVRVSSAYNWNCLFHVEFADVETGWMNYGFRYYSVELGRWLSEDPFTLLAGTNFYKFIENSPHNVFDVFGLEINPLDEVSKKALQQLKNLKDPTLDKILSSLEQKGKLHTIRAGFTGTDKTKFSGNTMGRFENNKGADVDGTGVGTQMTIPTQPINSDQGTRFPADVLAHELMHAFDYHHGIMDRHAEPGNIDWNSEVRAYKLQNHVRSLVNLPPLKNTPTGDPSGQTNVPKTSPMIERATGNKGDSKCN